jgi:S-methylmethionine-dependent homocysteine/selenocysteine methylase
VTRYRTHLPQLDGDLFLTDGGLETELIFHDGIDLPLFASFDLLKDEAGTERLRTYYARYVELARARGLGAVLETPTWRASPRWAGEIGYSDEQLVEMNRKAVALLEEVRDAAGDGTPIVISGNLGPQDDAYSPTTSLTPEEAQAYHATQVGIFAGTAADQITAMTVTYVEEAIGIVRAAREAGMPVVISFTVETDGRLPSGQGLAEAIAACDAATEDGPGYYMVNCAHPSHFDAVLEEDAAPLSRIRGVRANASMLSHAELDEATELDEGDPADLGARYAALRAAQPQINVLGGCCGTDHRHVEAIRDAVLSA